MHRTGKKENKTEKKKNEVTKNLLQGDSNLDSPNTLGLKMNACIHWTNSISADNSSLKEVYIPSLWWLTVFKDDFYGFRVELNLYLIEARRKSHNKHINTLSGLVNAGERLRNLSTIDLGATDWTGMTVRFSPCSWGVFHRSGKTLTQHCLSLFPLF